jgi:hypothetical protein
LDQYAIQGIVSGPLFRTRDGQRIKINTLEPLFFDRLEQVQSNRLDLIPDSVEVAKEYGTFRSFRRGSDSVAKNQGLLPDVIDDNNRWRKFERAGASQPSLPMRDHYADVRLLLNQLLRYLAAL